MGVTAWRAEGSGWLELDKVCGHMGMRGGGSALS